VYTNNTSDGCTSGGKGEDEDISGPLDATAKHVVGLGHETGPMPVIPFGSRVLCQVRPPLELDSTIAPPVSPTATAPLRKWTGVWPDIQHSDALGHAKPTNTSSAGNPCASTEDQDSPPLAEAKKANAAGVLGPPPNDMFGVDPITAQASWLLQESDCHCEGSAEMLLDDHSRPLSVL
jgi:hypothetical protein